MPADRKSLQPFQFAGLEARDITGLCRDLGLCCNFGSQSVVPPQFFSHMNRASIGRQRDRACKGLPSCA